MVIRNKLEDNTVLWILVIFQELSSSKFITPGIESEG
jgi:hypothetical protein